jgi:hypothetical protein
MDGGAAFPANGVQLMSGTLEGSIQWGEAEGPEPLLLHAITLMLAPRCDGAGASGG